MLRKSVVAFSTLICALPVFASPTRDPEEVARRAALETALGQAEAELFEPGPVQPGWERGGIDVRHLVEAAPGGASKNYLLSVDADGLRSVTILNATNSVGPPSNWHFVSRSGSQRPQKTDLFMSNLDGPFFVVGWGEERRVGDAYCSSGNMGGELHRSDDVEADPKLPNDLLPVLFNAVVKRFGGKTICWRFDAMGDEFAVTYFLEDGRTLPAMNKGKDRVTVVPAGPVEDLLASPAVQK